MTEFSHLLGIAENFVHDYGAFAVMVLIMLEAIGAPAPGESLLIFASALAARGELSFPTLFAGAWVGAVVGDNLGFAIGRKAGRALILRYGTRVGLTPERLGKVEAIFQRFGALTVIFARFVAFLRQLNGPVAGTLAMQWRRFAVCDLVGVTLWVSAYMVVGGYVGEHAGALARLAHRFWWAAVSLGLLALGLAVLLRMRTRRQQPG